MEDIYCTVPVSFLAGKNLKHLNASHNDLTDVGAKLAKCPRLETLNLSFNRLVSFPTSVTRMKLLQHLDISFNDVEQLPESFGEANKLTTLNVSNNLLLSFPGGKTTALSYVYLHDCLN